jgi:hypothetical protein
LRARGRDTAETVSVAHFVDVPIENVDERDVRDDALFREIVAVLLDLGELDAERGTKPCRHVAAGPIRGDDVE